MNAVTESTVEEAALGWFAELGYQVRPEAIRVEDAARLVGAAV